MAGRHRQHQNRCLIPAISTLSAITAAALFILSVLSFLTLTLTPPGDNNPRHYISISLKKNADVQKNAIRAEGFRVPNVGGRPGHDLWHSKEARYYHGCSNSTNRFPKADAITVSNRYLMIATSGGLNQQRTGITDAVVAARILNATLVVPKLDQKSFWRDSSDFNEIFDVDWFISHLSKDVKVIKQLPKKGGKIINNPYTMRVPRKCTPRCYQNRVLPVLRKKRVVRLTKFDYRLANKLDTDLQKLRCRVNYHALKFTNSILRMGETLMQRMRSKSRNFIALHLRFEPDMLAFSGCYYGGGEKEKRELGAIRKRWKTLHTSNPDKERRHGKCPLTPEEVGLMLRALGFGSDVHIYVASGEVYGGEETLAPLKALFPNFYSKDALTTKEELTPFSKFSSRMAALDFIVCDESDVFVTNNNGNMARMLAGRRRYFGHKRTIHPNSKKLYSLFLNRSNLSWETFAAKVRSYQRGFMGEPNEVRPGRGEFHENPSICICKISEEETLKKSKPRIENEVYVEDQKYNPSQETGDLSDDEPDSLNLDNGENGTINERKGNASYVASEDPDYDPLMGYEDNELEDLLSD